MALFHLIPVSYVQISLAALLGLVLGLQREHAGKSAGIRTYTLVTLGATLFTVISRTGFNEFLVEASRYDPSRIASNIVVGIGFLGAGVIIFRERKVQGLTTAAGLWVSAGIGMAVGAGLLGLATFATVITFIILEFFNRFDVEDWFPRQEDHYEL